MNSLKDSLLKHSFYTNQSVMMTTSGNRNAHCGKKKFVWIKNVA